MLREKLSQQIIDTLKDLGVEAGPVFLDYPADPLHGDYSSNVALQYAKQLGRKPVDIAIELVGKLTEIQLPEVSKIEVAGPGFINFYLSNEYLIRHIEEIVKLEEKYGTNKVLKGKKYIIEHTDPNICKPLHIGHVMTNAIGESLSRLLIANGGKVTKVCYPSDVGLNVAKAIWGVVNIGEDTPDTETSLSVKSAFLGRAYVFGTNAYEESLDAKKEIQNLNKAIYERSDTKINALYDWARKVSLDHFNEICEKLGTEFDRLIYESEVAEEGKKIVEKNLKKGVFEISDEAVIFNGEQHGLHTRVFINSQGLPTYETKEIGLNKQKFEIDDFDESIIVTAHEQNEYFKVVLKAISLIYPKIAERTRHIGHGMLRLTTGKMSSRKGGVITGESLIDQVEELVKEKMSDREINDNEREKIISQIAVGAIKYSILKQAIGRDIIFDFEKSLSFEGDSGPYLQYAATRAGSILEKAEKEKVEPRAESTGEIGTLERYIYRFPEIVERAGEEYAPHYLATYLIELAALFNSWYAAVKIVDPKDPESPYKVALTKAFRTVMQNGLSILGIQSPQKM